METSVPSVSWGSHALFSMRVREDSHFALLTPGALVPMHRAPGVTPLSPSSSCAALSSRVSSSLRRPARRQGLSPPSPSRLPGSRPLVALRPSLSTPAHGNSVPFFEHSGSWALRPLFLEPTHLVPAPGTLPGAVPPFSPLGPRSAPWNFDVAAKAAGCDLSSDVDVLGFARGWPPIQLATGQ